MLESTYDTNLFAISKGKIVYFSRYVKLKSLTKKLCFGRAIGLSQLCGEWRIQAQADDYRRFFGKEEA